MQNNNIRSLREWDSSDQRLCWALITRVAEKCAMNADWIDLCYEALINFSSSAKITVSDAQQCMTEILLYCILTMMSLLHMSQQQEIVTILHRVEALCIINITQRQMLSSFQTLTELAHHLIFSSFSEDVNYHKLICQQWLRSLLITLSLKFNRFVYQRQTFTVVYSCEFKCSNIDDLYTLCQHLYKYNRKYNTAKKI